MKTNFGKLVVFAAVVAMLVAGMMVPKAIAGEGIRGEYWGKSKPRRFELTDKHIKRMMARIKETDPNKAEQLVKLQQADPNAFKAELRQTMRDRRGKWQKGHEGKPEWLRYEGRRSKRGDRHGGKMKGMHGRRHGEVLDWLKENYPEKAAKLERLAKENPEHFGRRMGFVKEKYGRIIDAAKRNPELAEVLKNDLELKGRRHELLREIKQTEDAKQKDELLKKLEDVVGKRFDLLVRRKEIRYEQLQKRLEAFQKKVAQSKSEVEKEKDPSYRAQNVKQRVEKLLSEGEDFKWE